MGEPAKKMITHPSIKGYEGKTLSGIDLGFREEHYKEVDYQQVEASKKLWAGLMDGDRYKVQTMRILEGQCELAPDFLGFVGIYYNLSKIIPLDRTIYDMGCCNGFQAWFFRRHKRYVGVDLIIPVEDRLSTPNSYHAHSSIDAYCKILKPEQPHFAICNYVPPWHADNEKVTKDTFKHVFIFYPETNNNR